MFSSRFYSKQFILEWDCLNKGHKFDPTLQKNSQFLNFLYVT
jgi:hypothetical protein